MASVSQLVRIVADATQAPMAGVKLRARKLLDDNLLPQSRGRQIAEVTSSDAANLLLAVMAADRHADASRVVVQRGGLLANGDGTRPRWLTASMALAHPLTLQRFLAAALGKWWTNAEAPQAALPMSDPLFHVAVELWLSMPAARVTWGDDVPEEFAPLAFFGSGEPSAQHRAGLMRTCTVFGATLAEIGGRLAVTKAPFAEAAPE